MSRTVEWLAKLVRHETVSDASNLDLIDEIETALQTQGFRTMRLLDPDQAKAGLFAEIGPSGPGGILWSAHSDVVPVTGQAWSRDPFRLSEDGPKLFGRGTTDMKGFLAAMMAGAERAARLDLSAPLKLLVSYDEEIGCVGLARMLPKLPDLIGAPRLAVVGEPTEMMVAVGHKGKRAYLAHVSGQAGHSALAPRFVNAINVAADFIRRLEAMQVQLAESGPSDSVYDIPYSTVHVGKVSGGRALNIVADHAELLFETRFLPAVDPDRLEADIREAAFSCGKAYGSENAVSVTRILDYPGLSESHDGIIALLKRASGRGTCKVAFGTEAGFLSGLGIPTLVCGPGSMEGQGHKPDEYITRDQLAQCDQMLDVLLQELTS